MSMWFGEVMDAKCFGECVCDCISTQKAAAIYAKEFLRRIQILRRKKRTLFAITWNGEHFPFPLAENLRCS